MQVHDSKYESMEKTAYDKMWKSMNGGFSNNTSQYTSNTPYDSVVKFYYWISKKIAKGKFLDVGCGNGRHIRIFDKKYECTGMDISRYAIEIARKNVPDSRLTIDSILSTKHRDKYDIILDCGCLHHMRKSQWQIYKTKILELLKEKGYYLLICFSTETKYKEGGFAPKSKRRNWTLRGMHYNHFFTVSEINKLFEKDFKTIKRETFKRFGKPVVFHVTYMQKK
jgi:cyclopropane fatty-acyl-phospholipid synthase-like methyltransferase